MDDFSAHLRKTVQLSIFFLSASLLAWAFLPEYRPYAAGLILGVFVSLINSLYLAWKIRTLAQAAIDNAGKRVNLGFLTRSAMALLAVLVPLKTDGVALSTTLAGLFFVQIIAVFVGLFSLLRGKRHV